VSNTADLDRACEYALDNLIHELEVCRQEHEAAFPDLPVDRLVFIGGEARQEGIRQRIAKKMKLPEQIGDSLCRMVRNSRIGIECAIDRRLPQPAWAAAIGLSMGPGRRKIDGSTRLLLESMMKWTKRLGCARLSGHD